MRKHFTPAEVVGMTAADLQELVGKYVNVETAASEWYKENVPDGGDWEGGSGVCVEAGIQPRKVEIDGVIHEVQAGYVEWDYGMSWFWTPDQATHISACDEHGEHRTRYNRATGRREDDGDEGAAECLSTLGVRGDPGVNRKEDPIGEREEAEVCSALKT